MERKTFFKNLFGAGLVATLPTPLFNKIVELPPPEPPTFDIAKSNSDEKMGLWIFDRKNNFVARALSFSVSVEQNIPGKLYHLWQWGITNVTDFTLAYKNAIEDMFNSMEAHKGIVVYENYRAFGLIYITEFCTILGKYSDYTTATFSGSGLLIIK